VEKTVTLSMEEYNDMVEKAEVGCVIEVVVSNYQYYTASYYMAGNQNRYYEVRVKTDEKDKISEEVLNKIKELSEQSKDSVANVQLLADEHRKLYNKHERLKERGLWARIFNKGVRDE